MNFVILRSEGVMSIDNAALELDTAPWIAANIEIVAWQGDVGSGFIEYNDRPRVTTKTTRLEDYLTPIDRWIEAAALLKVPLTPLQARRIKIDVVDALYKNKRIASFWYGGYEFDGADEAVSHMAAAVAARGVYDRIEELRGQTNSAFSTKTSEVNTEMVGRNNASAPTINGWMQAHAGNWAGLNMTHGSVISGGMSGPWLGGTPPDQAWAVHQHPVSLNRVTNSMNVPNRSPGSGGMPSMNSLAVPSVAAGGNTGINWRPLNTSSPFEINANTIRDALRGIVSRRINLDSVRAAKKRALNAAVTIPGVLAVDVAGGW